MLQDACYMDSARVAEAPSSSPLPAGVHRRIEEGFAAVGLRLEPGSRVLVKLAARLDANHGFSVEVLASIPRSHSATSGPRPRRSGGDCVRGC